MLRGNWDMSDVLLHLWDLFYSLMQLAHKTTHPSSGCSILLLAV